MEKFFKDLDSLQKFTSNLAFHQDKLICPHCRKKNQFVAHDYTYRKQRSGGKIITGKRIFCSNRSGRSGCGRTFKLYLIQTLPALRYTSHTLLKFINALNLDLSVQKAYYSATGTADPRNAWRWLRKLYDKRIIYRSFFSSCPNDLSIQTRSLGAKKWKLILSTITHLFAMQVVPTIEHFQLFRQNSFI